MKKVERWKVEMPTEEEMLPKDKYSVFDRKVKRYRKGIHSKFNTGGLVEKHKARLTSSRGTEVDEGQPETQSSWFLDDHGVVVVYSICLYTFASDSAYGWMNNSYFRGQILYRRYQSRGVCAAYSALLSLTCLHILLTHATTYSISHVH